MTDETKIIFWMQDGKIKHFAPSKSSIGGKGLTKIIEKTLPKNTRYVIVDRDDIPHNGQYNRYLQIDFDNNRVLIDDTSILNAEKQMRLGYLLNLAEKKEKQLAELWSRAGLKNGASEQEVKTELKAKYSALENLISSINSGSLLDSITDIEQIRNFTPEELR